MQWCLVALAGVIRLGCWDVLKFKKNKEINASKIYSPVGKFAEQAKKCKVNIGGQRFRWCPPHGRKLRVSPMNTLDRNGSPMITSVIFVSFCRPFSSTFWCTCYYAVCVLWCTSCHTCQFLTYCSHFASDTMDHILRLHMTHVAWYYAL